jgi:hypothetical protein
MSITYSFSYTILRYVRDTTTGEFINVGVALYAPDARYTGAICRPARGRLGKVFPGISGDALKSLMSYIQTRFDELGQQLSTELQLTKIESVLDLAQSILPRDESSLQWSPVGGGRTEDPAKELKKIYERMVTRYENQRQRKHRDDQEVWRLFKRELEQRNLLNVFKHKIITVQDDEVEFEHAWKNGVWHCVEPISFDLSAAEGIRDKAHLWLGQFASVQNAEEKFKLYLLVGGPQQAQLQPAYHNALSILGKIPVETEIFGENDVSRFSDRIADEMGSHINI